MKFKLSELLPKDEPTDPDEWVQKIYEVLDPLSSWQWRHGVPVCISCQADDRKWQGTVEHTLRADAESCRCNCGTRPMRLTLQGSLNHETASCPPTSANDS